MNTRGGENIDTIMSINGDIFHDMGFASGFLVHISQEEFFFSFIYETKGRHFVGEVAVRGRGPWHHQLKDPHTPPYVSCCILHAQLPCPTCVSSKAHRQVIGKPIKPSQGNTTSPSLPYGCKKHSVLTLLF